ncbi:MAG: hypothetical protein HRT64_13945, partial [Erythrobacter sp.]|nr:hypothetical protein [Erythrobacter sp.]
RVEAKEKENAQLKREVEVYRQSEMAAVAVGVGDGEVDQDGDIEWFADKDVAFSPVLDFREAFDEPHIAERGLIVEAPGGGRHIAPAIRFAGEEWTPAPIPRKGEHS